jgi:hypothetical protein
MGAAAPEYRAVKPVRRFSGDVEMLAPGTRTCQVFN